MGEIGGGGGGGGVINQSDLKNKFLIFGKFRLTISVWCLYNSVINLSFPMILGITHG